MAKSNKILKYFCKHKIFTITLITLLPLIIVHILFSMPASKPFMSAHWSAGDLIMYIAGVEAFIGTMTLGLISMKQSNEANKLSNKATQISQKMLQLEAAQHFPLFDFVEGQNADNHAFLELCNRGDDEIVVRLFLKNIGSGIAMKSTLVNAELALRDKFAEYDIASYYQFDQAKYNTSFDSRTTPVKDTIHFHIPFKKVEDKLKIDNYNTYLSECCPNKILGEHHRSEKVICIIEVQFTLYDYTGVEHKELIKCTFEGEFDELNTISSPSFYNRELRLDENI